MINCHHSSIWKFLEFIKKDQRDNEIIIQQLLGGHTRVKHPIKREYIESQEQIENIVSQYEEYKRTHEIDTYLRAISYRIKRQESEGERANNSDDGDG